MLCSASVQPLKDSNLLIIPKGILGFESFWAESEHFTFQVWVDKQRPREATLLPAASGSAPHQFKRHSWECGAGRCHLPCSAKEHAANRRRRNLQRMHRAEQAGTRSNALPNPESCQCFHWFGSLPIYCKAFVLSLIIGQKLGEPYFLQPENAEHWQEMELLCGLTSKLAESCRILVG